MKYINELGIEKEVWLLDDKGKIIEPAIYSFPHDDFGFLIEIRTRPHTSREGILGDLDKLTKAFEYQADLFELTISDEYRKDMDRALIDTLYKKYNYYNLKDLTENVKDGISKTHATGLSGNYLTAGLHVHFSRKYNGKRIQLPIRKMVEELDDWFRPQITNTNRIFGEYEIKPYGFEYRSLPNNTDIDKVLNVGFSLLERYREEDD